MELVRWKDAIKEFLVPCCYRFASDICTCVKAVDADLKPSYMFDLAFLPPERIIAWLQRLHDVHLVQSRLSVIVIEQQIFIVKRSSIKHRMNEIKLGNERVIIIDVSSDLQQPQSPLTTVILQYTAQVVDSCSCRITITHHDCTRLRLIVLNNLNKISVPSEVTGTFAPKNFRSHSQ